MMNLMIPGGALLMFAAYSSQQYRTDFWLLAASGFILAASGFLWTAFDVGKAKEPIQVILSLALSPILAYPIGIVLGLRYFFTPVQGWVKNLYLIGGVICLLPIIAIVAIGGIMALSSKN